MPQSWCCVQICQRFHLKCHTHWVCWKICLLKRWYWNQTWKWARRRTRSIALHSYIRTDERLRRNVNTCVETSYELKYSNPCAYTWTHSCDKLCQPEDLCLLPYSHPYSACLPYLLIPSYRMNGRALFSLLCISINVLMILKMILSADTYDHRSQWTLMITHTGELTISH